MINERLTQILILTLLGGGTVIILVLLPMMHRVQGFEYQERRMAKDAKMINDLMKTQGSDHVSPRLIALQGTPMVMEEIAALGNTHSIIFLLMASQEKSKSSYKKIHTLPIDLETQSTYQQLGLFMGGLNRLRRGIVLVDSFQIIQDMQEPGKVKTKMHMHICLKKEGNGKK